MNDLQQLPALLLPWYEKEKRRLPWREDKDPYHVWLSEIMLQQTRVEAVIGYYRRFLDALPTIKALAETDEETLLKLWEGLGYYNRARNLQKAAQVIAQQHGGVFPNTYDAIRALPWTAMCCVCLRAIAKAGSTLTNRAPKPPSKTRCARSTVRQTAAR